MTETLKKYYVPIFIALLALLCILGFVATTIGSPDSNQTTKYGDVVPGFFASNNDLTIKAG